MQNGQNRPRKSEGREKSLPLGGRNTGLLFTEQSDLKIDRNSNRQKMSYLHRTRSVLGVLPRGRGFAVLKSLDMSTFVSRAIQQTSDPCIVHGQSEAIQVLNAIVSEIARTDIPVLLMGESGTGKDVYVQLIHRLSAQSHLPLRKLCCTTLEPGQLLAQLKGFLREQSEGGEDDQGTVFIDGIDELDMACQKVLLSLLQDGVSSGTSRKRLRLISAASRKLDTEIESGRFRRELYFRMSGICLRLPPLRERKEDIPALMEYFLAKHASELRQETPTLGKAEMDLLTSHNWPGNIRELDNLARKVVALGDPKLAISDFRAASPPVATERKEARSFSLKTVARAASRQAERELILKALEQTHWNRKRAAQELQISYKSLLYKIKQTGVEGTKPDDP
jgi:two-component system response regulator AtoC